MNRCARRKILLVEDSGWAALRPLTWLRPAGELLVGALTQPGDGGRRPRARRPLPVPATRPRGLGCAGRTARLAALAPRCLGAGSLDPGRALDADSRLRPQGGRGVDDTAIESSRSSRRRASGADGSAAMRFWEACSPGAQPRCRSSGGELDRELSDLIARERNAIDRGTSTRAIGRVRDRPAGRRRRMRLRARSDPAGRRVQDRPRRRPGRPRRADRAGRAERPSFPTLGSGDRSAAARTACSWGDGSAAEATSGRAAACGARWRRPSFHGLRQQGARRLRRPQLHRRVGQPRRLDHDQRPQEQLRAGPPRGRRPPDRDGTRARSDPSSATMRRRGSGPSSTPAA